MAFTISNLEHHDGGSLLRKTFDLTWDSSYAGIAGETFVPGDIGLTKIKKFNAGNKDGFKFDYDYTNDKIFAYDKAFVTTKLTLTDLDAAAATGVAVYIHIDETIEQGSTSAHAEFISPTTTDGTGVSATGGPTYYLQHDASAASGGVALYFDEDATLGSRLLANTGRDCWLNIGGGRYVKVTHNATPATPGVQVYFDEDAATATARLLFVSPTNASGYDITSPQVDSAIDLSGLSVRCEALGV